MYTVARANITRTPYTAPRRRRLSGATGPMCARTVKSTQFLKSLGSDPRHTPPPPPPPTTRPPPPPGARHHVPPVHRVRATRARAHQQTTEPNRTHTYCCFPAKASVLYDELVDDGVFSPATVSLPTFYRYLSARPEIKAMTGYKQDTKERKRFAYDKVNALWQADISMYLTLSQKR